MVIRSDSGTLLIYFREIQSSRLIHAAQRDEEELKPVGFLRHSLYEPTERRISLCEFKIVHENLQFGFYDPRGTKSSC